MIIMDGDHLFNMVSGTVDYLSYWGDRDQTFMFSLNEVTPIQFFAGLYAHTDLNYDPMSAGRQMGSSFSTHSLDEKYEQ